MKQICHPNVTFQRLGQEVILTLVDPFEPTYSYKKDHVEIMFWSQYFLHMSDTPHQTITSTRVCCTQKLVTCVKHCCVYRYHSGKSPELIQGTITHSKWGSPRAWKIWTLMENYIWRFDRWRYPPLWCAAVSLWSRDSVGEKDEFSSVSEAAAVYMWLKRCSSSRICFRIA